MYFVGRVLDRVGATSTSINTTGFESLLNVVDTTKDSFDLFYGLYKYNPASKAKLEGMESALRSIRKDLEEQEKKDDGNFRYVMRFETQPLFLQQSPSFQETFLLSTKSCCPF